MNQAVILSAVRTPVGRYMEALKTVEAYDQAALVLDEAVKGVNNHPDEVDDNLFWARTAESSVVFFSIL